MRTWSLLLVAVLGLPMLMGGCTSGDTAMYVRNDSDSAWYVSVLRTSKDPYSLWVVRVQPGADTFAVSWDGGRDVPVTVLAADCKPVGEFRSDGGDAYVVDAVPGLTGRVGGRILLGSRVTTPGIEDTLDCGGVLYH